MEEKKAMTYAGSGVNYEQMDPFKRLAQEAGRETARHLQRFGFAEMEGCRGESAYVVRTPHGYIVHVEEGLGTKNLVADEFGVVLPYYACVAQDTVAMIVNDMATVGGLPFSIQMHLAVGSSDWLEEEDRVRDLIEGWRHACGLAGCSWGGGETPTLNGLIVPGKAVLSGSAVGIVRENGHLIRERIKPGDQIILLESSGIHANGLTMARRIAEKLPESYATPLSDGKSYGEHLLRPTSIYVMIIEALQRAGVEIHYAVNVTGHGWRKLMRAKRPFAYIIEHLPTQLPVFAFMQEHGPITDEEAYGNFNMGAGFALYIPERDVRRAWSVLHELEAPHRCGAVLAGHVEAAETSRVEIRPKNIIFESHTLQVR